MDHKKYLQENVLPFWLKNAFDYENGGIITCIDREGNVYGEEKSGWFQGRAMWTYSKAYNFIEKKPEYLEAAMNCYKFLPKITGDDGRMHFRSEVDGTSIQHRRYTACEVFASIGCSQLYRATGDESIWAEAKNRFELLMKYRTDPSLTPPKFNYDAKSHSNAMIMVNTARCMAEAAPEAEKEYFLDMVRFWTNEVIHGGYINRDLNMVLEQVGPNGEFLNTVNGRSVNPGHALETAWFILIEGLLEKNDEALEAGKYIIDTMMPVGIDKKHGGIIAFCDALGGPCQQLEWDMKLWWPQNEAIIANRVAYSIFGEDKYKQAYEELHEYAFKHFEDKEYGEWYGYLHYDNTVAHTLKGNIFRGPFHLPRMLMVLHAMDNGDVLDFFR